jgi:hypothetical protein
MLTTAAVVGLCCWLVPLAAVGVWVFFLVTKTSGID